MHADRIPRTLGWLAIVLGALWIGIVLYAPIYCPTDAPLSSGCPSEAQMHPTLPFYGLALSVALFATLLGLTLVGLVAGVTMSTGAARWRAVGMALTWLCTVLLALVTWMSTLLGPWLIPSFVSALLATIFSTVRATPAASQ